MRNGWRVPGLLLIVLLVKSMIWAESMSITKPMDQGGRIGGAATVLCYISTTYHLPMIAELVYSENVKMEVPAGSRSAQDLLDIVARERSLRWAISENVVHVFDPRLEEQKGNYLNHRFKHFQVPSNVAELEQEILARLNTVQAGIEDSNGLVSGVWSGVTARGLDAHTLTPELLSDVTVRNILLKEASAGRFYSIIVYPHLITTKPSNVDWNYISSNWFWSSVDTALNSDLVVEKPNNRKALQSHRSVQPASP